MMEVVDKQQPFCGVSAHRRWLVVRDGFFGTAPRRRQRYRCVNPNDRSEYHRFTPQVMRVETTDHRCLDCQNVLLVGTGPVAPRRYDYVAREVAAALVALARGSTYQDAAQAAREAVRHELSSAGADDWWPSEGSVRHGQLAADWLGVFGPVVLAGLEDTRWPDVVLLDSTSFWRRRGGASVPAFHVLAAYGYDLTTPVSPQVPGPSRPAPRIRTIPGGAPGLAPGEDPWATPPVLDGVPDVAPLPATGNGRLLRAVAYRSSNLVTWTDFLASWPGKPLVVVADAAREIRPAVRATWPDTPTELGAEFVSCRWHWAKNLRSTLAEDLTLLDERDVPDAVKRKTAQEHPLWVAAEHAFDSREQWDTYRRLTHEALAYHRWPAPQSNNPRAKRGNGPTSDEEWLPSTLAWLRDHDLAFLIQQARRATRPGPESTGPLEAELQFLREHLARRAQSLRNRERSNLLLRLMVVGRRGHAN